MDCKVEVLPCLQRAADGRQNPSSSQMDFRTKLELHDTARQPAEDFARSANDRQQEQEHDLLTNRALEAHREDATRLAAFATEITQPTQHLQAKLTQVLELYSLGALAGHHLSHVPQQFAGAEPLAALAATAAPSSSPYNLPIPSAVETAALQPGEDAHGGMASARADDPQTEESLERHQQARMIGEYLASKWPQRQVQVLLRGRGIELVIRDYHLAPEEHRALVEDLLRHMPSLLQQPEQVWLNGQCVWKIK